MSLAGIVESLRHAGEHGDARWEFIGAAGSRTSSSSGICVDATAPYADPDAFDFVFVIGGLFCDLAEASQAHRKFLYATARSGTTQVGVSTAFCAGPRGTLRRQAGLRSSLPSKGF